VIGPVPRLAPLGDAAITITYGSILSPAAHLTAVAHSAAIRAAGIGHVTDVVPGYVATTVHYDPVQATFDEVRDAILRVIGNRGSRIEAHQGRRLVIPVRYDGPDLEQVARMTRLTIDQVVARHSEPEYQVAMLGFVPGFAYLGPLDPALVLPRRATPRTRVPAGSVAIGGEQTGIYPADTPGGWHLIGRTDLRLFDPSVDPPACLAVGDRVQFQPV
jgi:KipI family sensor histidine kinase inhibitor